LKAVGFVIFVMIVIIDSLMVFMKSLEVIDKLFINGLSTGIWQRCRSLLKI